MQSYLTTTSDSQIIYLNQASRTQVEIDGKLKKFRINKKTRKGLKGKVNVAETYSQYMYMKKVNNTKWDRNPIVGRTEIVREIFLA